MPSASSSPEYACTVLHKDRDGNTIPCPDEKPPSLGTACACGHALNWHDHGRCTIGICGCTEFCSKDTLPRGGAEGVHVHKWGTWDCIGLDRNEVWTRRCPCGTSQSRSERPSESDWCDVCREDRPCVCDEEPQVLLCGICLGPHGTEACKGLEEPEGVCVCGHPEGEHRAGLSQPYDGCNWCELEQCGGYRTEPEEGAETAPVPIPRRPPYAVAYAIEGGAQYEVAVSGDATVVAEDGALHILHPKKAVLAITRIQPMNMEEEAPDGA